MNVRQKENHERLDVSGVEMEKVRRQWLHKIRHQFDDGIRRFQLPVLQVESPGDDKGPCWWPEEYDKANLRRHIGTTGRGLASPDSTTTGAVALSEDFSKNSDSSASILPSTAKRREETRHDLMRWIGPTGRRQSTDSVTTSRAVVLSEDSAEDSDSRCSASVLSTAVEPSEDIQSEEELPENDLLRRSTLFSIPGSAHSSADDASASEVPSNPILRTPIAQISNQDLRPQDALRQEREHLQQVNVVSDAQEEEDLADLFCGQDDATEMERIFLEQEEIMALIASQTDLTVAADSLEVEQTDDGAASICMQGLDSDTASVEANDDIGDESSPQEYDDRILDEDILETDILLACGEDDHPGNVYFLDTLEDHEMEYMRLGTMYHKEQMEFELVLRFRKEDVRFLAQDPEYRNSCWYDVGDQYMRKEISRRLKEAEAEIKAEILAAKRIEFTIATGDICSFEADVIAVQHTQGFCGADVIVTETLAQAGFVKGEHICPPCGHRLRGTCGGIRAPNVLYIGVPPFPGQHHANANDFYIKSLQILEAEAPKTRHLVLSLYGQYLEVDEIESFIAEVQGMLIAIQLGKLPIDLEQVTLLGFDSQRVNCLQQTLEHLFSGVNFAEPLEGTWGYRFHVSQVTPPSISSLLTLNKVVSDAAIERSDLCHEQQLSQLASQPDEKCAATSSFSKPAVPPSEWCISYQQLMALDKEACSFYGSEDYPSKTMRDVCEDIIKPSCSSTGTSYAVHLNPKGLTIDAFVSHSWDGHFAAFVQSIRNAFQTTMTKPNLWICAFALVQSPTGDASESIIAQQVGPSDQPLEESPFVLAIKEASAFCVVRNSRRDIYCRIWCVAEVMYAKHYGLLPGRTHVTGPDSLLLIQEQAFSMLRQQ